MNRIADRLYATTWWSAAVWAGIAGTIGIVVAAANTTDLQAWALILAAAIIVGGGPLFLLLLGHWIGTGRGSLGWKL